MFDTVIFLMFLSAVCFTLLKLSYPMKCGQHNVTEMIISNRHVAFLVGTVLSGNFYLKTSK